MHLIDVDDTLFADARGWVLNPAWVPGGPDAPLPDAHVVSLEPGAVRGNHRHPGVREWMIVFGAPVTVAGRVGDGPVETIRVDGERPAMVAFDAGEDHAVRGDGPATAYLVAFNDRPQPETVRVPPLLEAPGAPHFSRGDEGDGGD